MITTDTGVTHQKTGLRVRQSPVFPSASGAASVVTATKGMTHEERAPELREAGPGSPCGRTPF
jgi:hypothetical protein